MNDQPGGLSENRAAAITDAIGDIATSIPAPLRKSLMKAAGRLLLGIVEVPAATLEAKAKDIKHRQAMREKLRAAVTKAAIGRLPEHPEIAERALESFVSELLTKQEAREEVLRYATVELQESSSIEEPEATPQTEEPLDDDWLGAFGRHAENATSERARELFGRVLAGEIRKPRSFSLFTLDVLAKMGKSEAELLVALAPYVVANVVLLTEWSKQALDFMMQARLVEMNVITANSTGVGHAVVTVQTESDVATSKARMALVAGGKVVILTTDQPKEIQMNCLVLTQVGQELLTLHTADWDERALAEFAVLMKGQGAEVSVAEILKQEGSRTHFKTRRIIEVPTEKPAQATSPSP